MIERGARGPALNEGTRCWTWSRAACTRRSMTLSGLAISLHTSERGRRSEALSERLALCRGLAELGTAGVRDPHIAAAVRQHSPTERALSGIGPRRETRRPAGARARRRALLRHTFLALLASGGTLHIRAAHAGAGGFPGKSSDGIEDVLSDAGERAAPRDRASGALRGR